MPTWSKDFGGPLRNDQIDNVVNYIMNWEEGAPDLESAASAAPWLVPSAALSAAARATNKDATNALFTLFISSFPYRGILLK